MTSSETPRRASVLSTAFNLINCAIGAGVLGVPFAVRSMGAVLGALSLCLVMAISVLTLNVLTRAARAYGASSYQELVRKSMGWFAAHVVSLTLIAYVFGSCVAYTIVCADSFGEFNARAFGSGSFAANRSVIVLFTSTCVMLPLSLLRSMERMAFASSFSVLALLYTAVVVVAKGIDAVKALFFDVLDIATMMRHRSSGGGGPDTNDFLAKSTPSSNSSVGSNPHVRAWVLDKGTILALPVLVFAFQCHVQVVSIFAELRDPSRATRKPSSSSSVQAAAPGIEPTTSAPHESEAASVMNGPRWGKDFPPRGNDEVSGTYESEDEDEGDVFVDATSQSASGLSSLASSRGGSPAPSGRPGVPRLPRGDARATTISGASGSTLSMILSPSHARRPNTRRRLFSSSSSVNVGARTREGEAERPARPLRRHGARLVLVHVRVPGGVPRGWRLRVRGTSGCALEPSGRLPDGRRPDARRELSHGAELRGELPDQPLRVSRGSRRRLRRGGSLLEKMFQKNALHRRRRRFGRYWALLWARPRRRPVRRRRGALHADGRVRRVHDGARARRGRPRRRVSLVGATAGAVLFSSYRDPPSPSGYHARSAGAERDGGRGPGDPDEESGDVGVRTRDGGTHARAAAGTGPRWATPSGCDELTFSGALDAPLLPGDGPNGGGVGGEGGGGVRGWCPEGGGVGGGAGVHGRAHRGGGVHLIFADASTGRTALG